MPIHNENRRADADDAVLGALPSAISGMVVLSLYIGAMFIDIHSYL